MFYTIRDKLGQPLIDPNLAGGSNNQLMERGTMQDRNFVRMGDGERVLMSPGQITEDLLAGTQDAARRADIPALTSEELEQLFDIFADPSRIVSVSPGEEVIVTDDAVCTLFYLDQRRFNKAIVHRHLKLVGR